MGYWAKDGSYQYDESDNILRENETQKQEQGRWASALNRLNAEEERKKTSEKAQREFEANLKREEYEYQKEQQQKIDAIIEKNNREEKIRTYESKYGTNYDLRNPADLGERRARAALWSQRNIWCVLKNKINGKTKKFDELWDQFSKTTSESERQQIVEQMEKMFPTKERYIKNEERKTRGR